MGGNGAEQEHKSTRARLRHLARPGVIGSLLLHAAVLGLLLYQIGAPPVAVPVMPVDIVQLADETTTPAPQPNAPIRPSAGSSPQVASVAPPRAAPQALPSQSAPSTPTAPPSTEQPAPDTLPPAPLDPLQSQLDALAKLRTENSTGSANKSSGSSAPSGARAGYRVEDLIRAQVQRRWNLRLDELGERELTILIHVVLEPDGTVAKAEIVDSPRSKGDEIYRSIALSARNAVLLSSPLTLPAGVTAEMRDLTLSLSTRDTLR